MMTEGDNTSQNDDRPRDDKGMFVEQYDAKEILSALSSANDALTTEEIADEIDASYQTAYHYLRRLEEDGRIVSRKRAGARFWQLPN